jgi:hypothetical protein
MIGQVIQSGRGFGQEIVGTARIFQRSFGTRRFDLQKIQIRYRAPTSTLRCARPLQSRYHRCQGCAAPIDKKHQSPLTPMISRFAWVVVLAPIRGCGRESWEEEKGRKGEERDGRGVQFACQKTTSPVSLSLLFAIIYLPFSGK